MLRRTKNSQYEVVASKEEEGMCVPNYVPNILDNIRRADL
jgi:hypothetical protein